MILNRLARDHFPHLSHADGRAAVVRLLDALDRDTLAAARVERHHGTRMLPIQEPGGVAARSG